MKLITLLACAGVPILLAADGPSPFSFLSSKISGTMKPPAELMAMLVLGLLPAVVLCLNAMTGVLR